MKNNKKLKLSRRNFVKLSAATGVCATFANYGSTAKAKSMLVKEQDEFPLEINSDFERFDQINTIFMRARSGDETIQNTFFTFIAKDDGEIPPTGEIGYSEVDLALNQAGWSVESHFDNGSSGGIAGFGLYSWEGVINERKTTFKSPEEATKIVKRAAKFLGASLVGIAPYDEKWIYKTVYNPETGTSVPNEFPFQPKCVISMALEMNYEGFKTAPSLLESAAAGNIYSNMAVTAHKVATFLRRLGYQAIPCGNDTAMSVPIAIQAGLGELNRMGTLMTVDYGPRVRLCKVYTDLELKIDKPITFGVREFCETCLKCADSCPSEAISFEKEPNFNITTISNQKGVKKWFMNADKCVSFWAENGGDCGSCIQSCPYNKIDHWHHRLSRVATVVPGIRTVARELDDLFGYGKTFNEEAVKDFWEYQE